MELKVFEERKKKKEYYLRLIQPDSDYVKLVVVDETGNVCAGGYLLNIDSKGVVTLCSCVSDEFGFDLDKYGRLKVNSAT